VTTRNSRARKAPPKQRSPKKAAKQAPPAGRPRTERFSARAQGRLVGIETVELGTFHHQQDAVAAAQRHWDAYEGRHTAWVWNVRTGDTVFRLVPRVSAAGGGAR